MATLMDQNRLSAEAVPDQLPTFASIAYEDVDYERRIARTGAAEVLEGLE